MKALRPPAEFPDRKPPGTRLNYTLKRVDDGQLLKVPDYAVVRDYAEQVTPIEKPKGIHLTCFTNTNTMCDIGWVWIPPAQVKVLGCRDKFGRVHFGWYVGFASDEDPEAKILHRIPESMVRRIVIWMEDQPCLAESTLLTTYPDAYMTMEVPDACNFHEMMTKRCTIATLTYVGSLIDGKSMLGMNQPVVMLGKRLRSGHLVGVFPQRKHVRGDCAICLEDRVVTSACCVKMCASCHNSVRGLCPVCDRGQIQESVVCENCGMDRAVIKSSFPCALCGEHRVCEECFTEYGLCSKCG